MRQHLGCGSAMGVLPLVGFVLFQINTLFAAEPTPPAAPKVSTFAPADDLSRQVEVYLKELDSVLATEADFKDAEDKIEKDASTLAVIFLGLGMHDAENPYQAKAAALVKASQELAVTKDYASAQKAYTALKAALDGKGSGEKTEWKKVVPQPALMKQVPLINTKLKRFVKGNYFKTKAKDTAGYTAVIAAIAQGAMPDTSAAKNSDQIKQWFDFSVDMRDSAGEVNKAIRDKNEPAAADAMKKLQKSCEDCHAVFKPDAVIE